MAQPLNTEIQTRGLKRKITPILLIAGPWLVLALVNGQGIMIAPPHTSYTLVLYDLLLFGGPFWLVITGLRKKGWLRAMSFTGCFFALILGVIALVVLLALIGPSISTVWDLLFFGGPFLLVITGLRKEGWLRAMSFTGCFFALILSMIALVVLALLGPSTSVYDISGVDCPSESLAEGQVRYVCTVPFGSFGVVYTLEGSAGSPFVRLVNSKILNE